jgi:hypothetical protein
MVWKRTRPLALRLSGHWARHLRDGRARAAWKAYFNDVYNNSPILKEFLEAHSSWYGPRLREERGIKGSRTSHPG